MYRRSSGISICARSFSFFARLAWLSASFCGKTSAMATSLVGPLVERAFSAAPVPRPPQPTSARLIVLLSPAYIRGRMKLESAVAAATFPVVLIISRRVRPDGGVWFIGWLPVLVGGVSKGGIGRKMHGTFSLASRPSGSAIRQPLNLSHSSQTHGGLQSFTLATLMFRERMQTNLCSGE